MKQAAFGIIISLLVICCSCSSTGNISKTLSTLSRSDWQLFSLGTTQFRVAEDVRIPRLSFDSQKMEVSGNGGCNSLNGTFTAEKDNLSFGPIATTRMACAGNNIEPQFLEALSKTAKFSMYEGKLVLKDSAGTQLMSFDPVAR